MGPSRARGLPCAVALIALTGTAAFSGDAEPTPHDLAERNQALALVVAQQGREIDDLKAKLAAAQKALAAQLAAASTLQKATAEASEAMEAARASAKGAAEKLRELKDASATALSQGLADAADGLRTAAEALRSSAGAKDEARPKDETPAEGAK
jgi:hypothetical protein